MNIKEAATEVMAKEPAFVAGLRAGKSRQIEHQCPYNDNSQAELWMLGYKRGCELFNERQWQQYLRHK